jgi:Mg2+/citrate symporter
MEELKKLSYNEVQALASTYGIKGVGVKREVLEAQILEKIGDAQVTVEEQNKPQKEEKPKTAPALKKEESEPIKPKTTVYNHQVVVAVTNRLVSGVLYKDVHLANGETHTLSKEEFESQVTEQ